MEFLFCFVFLPNLLIGKHDTPEGKDVRFMSQLVKCFLFLLHLSDLLTTIVYNYKFVGDQK